jgi:hypothetical protein
MRVCVVNRMNIYLFPVEDFSLFLFEDSAFAIGVSLKIFKYLHN